MILAILVFFTFASLFYIKGVKKFLENKDFFERIEESRYFNDETKESARFFQNMSISPFFGFFIMLGMMFYPLFHKRNKKKPYKQDRVIRLVVSKFLEINTLSSPHFYVVGIFVLIVYLFVASIALVLTANLKKLFNNLVSFPETLLDGIGFSAVRLKRH